MEKQKWSSGAKAWFTLMILGQWLEFINDATKPSMGLGHSGTIAAGVVGAIGTALYLWLVFSKSKAALYTILAVMAANAVFALIHGSVVGAVLGLAVAAITYNVARKTVA